MCAGKSAQQYCLVGSKQGAAKRSRESDTEAPKGFPLVSRPFPGSSFESRQLICHYYNKSIRSCRPQRARRPLKLVCVCPCHSSDWLVSSTGSACTCVSLFASSFWGLDLFGPATWPATNVSSKPSKRACSPIPSFEQLNLARLFGHLECECSREKERASLVLV